MLALRVLRKALLTVALVPVLALVWLMLRWPLSWTDQAYLSCLVIVLSVLVGSLSTSRLATLTLTMLSLFCTFRYGIWRWSSSLTYLNHSGWHVERIGLVFALLLLGAETYAIVVLVLGYFQSARPLRRQPVPLPLDTNVWPSIDVYIPTYNEPLEVVRPTVLAAISIDWPPDRLNVYILDDGKRPAFRLFAEECGVGYITRQDNRHAKAGNINNALKVTNSEYVAIFDCDHIATRSFLQVTMGWFFKDSRLAMVQTPHHFYSPDPFERNLHVFRKVPNEGALFYGVVQDGNDLWNATFFCGSCAVMRRTALDEVGGIAVETVTEDAHTALRLQRRGWNTAYLGIPQAAGLATGSLSAHVGQRIRWARGMVQILRTECPLFVSGLRFSQRLCYLNCAIHYLYAIPRLIFVSAPLAYLIFGVNNMYGRIWEIMAYAAPHLVLSNMVNSRTQGNHRHSFWNEMYEMVLAPYILLPTTFALINPKWGKFNVTAKTSIVDQDFFDWRIARPYLFLLALNCIGIGIACGRYFSGNHSGVLSVNVVWALLNSLMLGACVAVSFESKQRRTHVRVEAPLAAVLELESGESHQCRVLDLSEGGLALRTEKILDIHRGQELVAILRAGDETHRFAVETVRTHENRIHMRFLGTDLDTHAALTKLIYARADSWLDWTKDQKRDRILASMLTIFGIGAHGLWLLPSVFIKRERKQALDRRRALSPTTKSAALPILLLLAWTAPILRAQTVSHDATYHPFKETVTLLDLGAKRPLVLHGATSETTFGFVLPSNKVANSSWLTIRCQPANVPAGAVVQLTVTLNDVEAGTVHVGRTPTEMESPQVMLPSDLLVHDNVLRFRVNVHCDAHCPDRLLDKASLRIDPTTTLSMAGVAIGLPNRLSILPGPFFDPSTSGPVHVQFAFSDIPDIPMTRAAGLVASWTGTLAGYRGSHTSAFFGQIPSGNVIVFATAQSELARLLGLSGSPSSIQLRDNPFDPDGKVLALIGSTSSELFPLAKALALNDVTGETDRLVLSQIEHFRPPAFEGSGHFASDAKIAIADQFDESLLHVSVNKPLKLYFRVAPDLDFGTQPSVSLDLAFHFDDLGPKAHASLGIDLNGTAIGERTLTGKESGLTVRHKFAVPVSVLHPGNTLTIRVLPENPAASTAEFTNFDLRFLPQSYLNLGNPTHFVRMPRLDLFAASGFPFTETPDLSATTFLIPGKPTCAQLGLLFDTIAFLAAQTKVPSLQLKVIQDAHVQQVSSPNLIVVGSFSNESLFRPFRSQMILTPAAKGFVSGNFSLPWSEWLARPWIRRVGQRTKLADYLAGNTPPTFLMDEFSNPNQARGTALVLATRSDRDESDYFSRVSVAANQGYVQGGLVLADEGKFQSFEIPTYFYPLGDSRSVAFLYSWMTFHLWAIPLFLLGTAFLVARWWETYLERQASQRLDAGRGIRRAPREA